MSILQLTTLVSRSNATSLTPNLLQSLSNLTISCLTLPRPTWKHMILDAGLMCKNFASQFDCCASNGTGALRPGIASELDATSYAGAPSDEVEKSAGEPRRRPRSGRLSLSALERQKSFRKPLRTPSSPLTGAESYLSLPALRMGNSLVSLIASELRLLYPLGARVGRGGLMRSSRSSHVLGDFCLIFLVPCSEERTAGESGRSM